MSVSTAHQITGVSALVGANGNLEIALATAEHLAALKANDMYDNKPNSEMSNGDLLHDNSLWGNMVDLNCFAIDLLFRTNASEASLLLQTDAIERVDDEDYEYLIDFSGSGSYIEIADTQLSSAIRVVFAGTLTGQVYTLAQADQNGKLHMTARMDENGNPAAVKPGDDPLIKPRTQNQVSAITAWVYLDGTLVKNRDAATAAATALKMNLQFATDIDLTPACPDGNGDYVRPVDPDAVSGVDGNITWTYTPSNKTLRLSGYGDMKDYDPTISPAPWYNLRNDIANVIIEKGITSIGDYAFSECNSLTSVTIPDSVTTIDSYAFDACTSLTDVYFEGSRAQWETINIGESNDPLVNATIHFAVTD